MPADTPADKTPATCGVLVVGAGPTGLMAANLLKRRGIAVRIVEQRADFAIQARSMELFEHLGLVDELLRRGVVNPGAEVYVGGDHVGGLDFDKAASPDTPYPFIFMLPQSQTEAILIEDLARLGVEIERDVTVTGLTQDDDGVSVQATTKRGHEVICSSYVIGADGPHSTVRKQLGLSFEGAKYPQTFLLADCRVNWQLDHARFRIFMNGSSTGLFLPLDGAQRSRVMATDHSGKADGGGLEASQLELAELGAAFAEVTNMDVTLSDPVWATRYRINHRSAERYQRGRVFVAGDAAHIHSPAGGQGMNTGLQDAANLAWKLASVIRDGAPSELLDTYDAERRAVGEQVVATSDRLFTAAVGGTGWQAAVRDWLARPVAAAVTKLGTLQHRAFRALSELELHYEGGRENAFLEDEASLLNAGPGAGQRAPNAATSRHSDVFDLTQGYGFTVLALSRKPLEQGEAHRVADELGQLSGENVKTYLVARLSVGRDPQVVFVSSAEVFEAYGLKGQEQQAIYVVRPDGYVCWRGDGLDFSACRRFLAHFGLDYAAAERVAA